MGWRQFSREFKLEAVRLVGERGVPVVQATKGLLGAGSSAKPRYPFWLPS